MDTVTESLMERIAKRFTTSLNTNLVYGTPIEKNDITIIPVALASYGFGVGENDNQNVKREGGGAGVYVKPIGYIEIKNNKAEFKPIIQQTTTAWTFLAAGFAGFLILRALRKLRQK